MKNICNDYTTVVYGRLIGNVASQSDLFCQLPPGHSGMHEVKRWFDNVHMTANWH